MAIRLPFYTESSFTYSINLGNTNYNFEFNWMDRTERWYMTLSDTFGNVIQSNIKLVPNLYLVRPHEDFVEGANLYLLRETSNTSVMVTRDNIGVGKEFNLYLVGLEEFNNDN